MNPLDRKTLGSTGLEVTRLGLGCAPLGGLYGDISEEQATEVVQRALALGLNLIDTAPLYGSGKSEKRVGAGVKGVARDSYILATKVGHPIGPEEDDKGLSREHILRECDRSLARLGTDWIDLYYMHAPYPNTPIQESIAAFIELVAAGKVRHWGISNFDAAQTSEVLEACDAGGWTRPVVHQPAYSLLKRDIEEDLLPLCAQERVGVVPYQVLQGGLLTGKYADATVPPAGSRAAEKPEWVPLFLDPAVHREISALRNEADELGIGLFDHVIRTTVDKQAVTSVILGVKRTEQLEAAIRALD